MCGETVVQKGAFGESVFLSAPLRFALKTLEKVKGAETKGILQNTLLDDRVSARRLLRSLGAPPELFSSNRFSLQKKPFFANRPSRKWIANRFVLELRILVVGRRLVAAVVVRQ